MTAEPLSRLSEGAPAVVFRLLSLLAAEAPLEDFHAVLADPALTSAADEAKPLREAVRDALQVRSLLAARRRREQELSALYETAGDLSSLRDLEAVLQAIVRRARQLLDTDAAYLMLHDESRQLTSMRVTDGIRTDAFKATQLRLGAGLGGMVAATCEPYATADYSSDERLQHRIDDVVAGEGLVAILGVPLRRRTSVIGVLFAANRRQRPFSRDETALLTSLADHAAIAIENASLFADVQAAVDELRQANALVRRNSEQVERATAMHERLHAVMLRGGRLREVVHVAEELLGGDLAVLDASGRTVAVVGDEARTEAVVEALTAEHGVLPGSGTAPGDRAALRHTVQSDGPAGTPVTVVPVRAGAEALGTVVFAGRVLDDLEVRLLERAAVVTALLLLHDRSLSEAEQQVRGELVDDLVSTPQRDATALHRRAAHLGLDLRTPYVVVVARPRDPAACVSGLRAGTLPGDVRPGLHALHQGDLVLLVPAEADGAAPERAASAAAARLSAQLRSAGGCAFTVGAAGPATGVGSVPELHRDAVRCCEVLVSLGRTGESASSDDLGVYGLLLGAGAQDDVRRFVRRTVGPVLDYDRDRGSELARTLLTWYSCGGNLTRTSAELYVHVNTLYQRLDRVTALLGDGWRSGDGALQTHLALQAHRALVDVRPSDS
ncbi:MAG: Regulator of polyketide synthase expression [uncultured Frankineae bacterium]|uniref:Regulator of polyketide synthase expression n=1 Tax=uncultured Frankineae bacterium TaxID=437475 RepID=A0A6J4L6C9_9ACTN|nr:MAG: Regulator of polyketide synthase expression [uncultured Frankineae bacterium]